MAIRFFLLVSLSFMVGCSPSSGPPPIVIGHVSDKTRLDKAGDQAERGIRLALHDLNNDTLAQEFGGRKLEVRHTDTRGQLEAFESQGVRLDSVNRCLALLGGMSTKETVALNNAKVPLLTMHGQPVSGANNYVFYLGMSPARQGDALAKFIAENHDKIRVAIVMDERRPEAIAVADAFQKALAEARKSRNAPAGLVTLLRFGEETKTPPLRIDEDQKWHELSERVINHAAHTVVFAGAVQDFNAWHKVLRKDFADVTLHLVFAGSDGAHRVFDLDAREEAPVLVASAFYADPASAKINAFTKAYREAYHVEADVHAAIAYDGFRILVEAMKRTPTQLNSEKVRDEMLKTKDFDGVTGTLTITPDRQVQRPIHVLRWQSGKLTLVKTFGIE